MGSPVDNLRRHISFCSEGLSGSLLLLGISLPFVGYPLIDCVTQDNNIIVLLGRIVKFGAEFMSQMRLWAHFFIALPKRQ